jgi:hypothetical protein
LRIRESVDVDTTMPRSHKPEHDLVQASPSLSEQKLKNRFLVRNGEFPGLAEFQKGRSSYAAVTQQIVEVPVYCCKIDTVFSSDSVWRPSKLQKSKNAESLDRG